ncbi:conserved oligomeric Golgi complex subunit, putative [Phytophthora infestans T30-4]|uniref:Conserved oligomeric Golgi complex subunit 4 n=1 Tax=Phytophthora infestans (strain T30-4) TaxID=403677 RepID=D0MY16_PHYIT|nr:conserved oligomeric Golgi complex subunit, putative [Phytophthora infestans T30-4]EEY66064.1 conserved oligomeric Golgi complex subunit, putative [Phytophthora infestans T30-4]|eukprot:XP_002906663.1 conserved oligomeric Golgi complex subunit, putative [Phytophthora infestans T30-4]
MGAPRRKQQEQHAALVAQLAAIKKSQQSLREDSLAFAKAPAAPEKAAAQRSLRSLRQLTPDVTVLCAQTGAVVERVANANDVAEKMTREVRRLDVIQLRLGEALEQSAQLLTLRNALAGIRRAMQQQRYPEAATFLQTLKNIEQQMPLDVADKLRVDTIENDLKAVIEGAFEDGLRAGDTRQVQTYAPLFKVVSKDYEKHGLVMLLDHVQKTLEQTLKGERDPRVGVFSTQELITHLAEVFNQVAQEAQQHAGLLSQCFERVYGPNRFVATLYTLGEQSAVAVLNAYMVQRKFHERITNGEQLESPVSTNVTPLSPSNRSGSTRGLQSAPLSPKDDGVAVMNEQLNEMALVIQHTQTYERFMRSRVVELGRTVQELAGLYCFFENALLNQAARKAFQWEELHFSSGDGSSGGAELGGIDSDDGMACFPISSAVDEIFYVARNSGLRALATGHVDCAAGVLNMINTVLRDVVGDTMRSRIRHMTTAAKMDSAAGADAASLLAASSAQLRDQMQQQFAKLSKTVGPVGGANTGDNAGQTPEQRKEHTPDVTLNSLEVTSGYIAQLKGEFERELPEAFPEVPQHIMTCLNALEDASAELKQLLLASRKKLLKLLEPKIATYLNSLLSSSASSAASALAASATALSSAGASSSRRNPVRYELTEAMFTFNEANDPFAHAFVRGLRSLLTAFRGNLSRSNYRAIVQGVALYSATQLESWFLSKATRVNQLGALQFDKDVRVISTYLSGEGGAGEEVREAFATLTQLSEVLNADSPQDVLDVYGRRRRGVAWSLPAARVKEILSRRVEFADASINKLVLK